MQVPVTTEAIAHPYALQEVYEMARAVPPFTRKVVEDGCVMDFIWCSRHLQVCWQGAGDSLLELAGQTGVTHGLHAWSSLELLWP